MAKYDPLYEFLKRQDAPRIALTFDEISRLIGEDLPESACRYLEWWANGTRTNPSHVQCYAWEKAGYKAKADLDRKTVVFEKA